MYTRKSGREELVLLCASCDRSGRSAWPELAPGLTLDSVKQKYAQTVVSTRIVPGCMQFLGKEKRFYTAWVKRRNTRCEPMSSAFPPKATVLRTSRHVSNVPTADMSMSILIDRLSTFTSDLAFQHP
jgi:hypothetical protein